jgi:outer membrane autotransporter protein
MQVIRNRLDKTNALSDQVTDKNSHFWVMPYGYRANQGASGVPAAAYTQNTGGLAIGMDHLVGEKFLVGGALLIESSNLQGADSQTQDKLSTSSYQLAAYAKKKFEQSTELSLIANAGLDQNNSSRVNTAGDNFQTASATYKGWHGFLSGELGHNIQFGKNTLTPIVNINYGFARVGGYNESGAGLYDLAVNAQTQSSITGLVGFKYQYQINQESKFLVRATAGHDFSAKPAALTATDGFGVSSTSYGNNPGSFVMQGGIGYEMQTKANMKIRLNYDYLGRNGSYSNNMINASMIIPF